MALTGMAAGGMLRGVKGRSLMKKILHRLRSWLLLSHPAVPMPPARYIPEAGSNGQAATLRHPPED